jgi:hypothetical protein
MRACGCAQRRFACVVQEAVRDRSSLVASHAALIKGLREQVRGSRAGRLPGVRATQRTMVGRSRRKPRPTQISLRSTPFFLIDRISRASALPSPAADSDSRLLWCAG